MRIAIVSKAYLQKEIDRIFAAAAADTKVVKIHRSPKLNEGAMSDCELASPPLDLTGEYTQDESCAREAQRAAVKEQESQSICPVNFLQLL